MALILLAVWVGLELKLELVQTRGDKATVAYMGWGGSHGVSGWYGAPKWERGVVWIRKELSTQSRGSQI